MTMADLQIPSATEMPSELEPYQRTANFTEISVPAALRKNHSTKPGVWGLIRVAEGELRYTVADPRRERTETMLTAESDPGVVEPTILHHVTPEGPVRFHVQFYRQTAKSAPLCRNEELAEIENRRRRSLIPD